MQELHKSHSFYKICAALAKGLHFYVLKLCIIFQFQGIIGAT